MSNKDYYQILGVSRDASHDEIRKAFKKIARENHPDAKKDDPVASERFKDAAEAYDVLGDKEKRAKYDQFGSNWKHFKDGQSPYGAGAGNPFRNGGPVDIDLRDIFGGQGAVDLEQLFGGMFGGGGGRGRTPRAQRGEDLTTSITVPFDVAALGGRYDLNIDRGGQRESLSIKIPAGIESGKSIRLAGQGTPGMNGGPNGDLLVAVQVAPHPYFRREGNDLYIEVPVTISEAVSGAKIDVPTLADGTVTVTLPAGTSSGARLRLKGKGVESPRSKTRGDQYVTIKIVVPKEIDDRSRELLDEFSARNPLSPRSELGV